MKLPLLAAFLVLHAAIPLHSEVVTLHFDSLPSAQGWQYLAGPKATPESAVFSVDGSQLLQNTIGIGSNFAGYERQTVIATNLPFKLSTRVRVVNSETTANGGQNTAFIAYVFSHSESFGFSLGMNQVHFPYGSGQMYPIDASQFHNYRVEATPGVSAKLFVDGVLLVDTTPWQACCNGKGVLGVGNASSFENGEVRLTEFLFDQAEDCDAPVFSEDFTSYEAGSDLIGQGGWQDGLPFGQSVMTVDEGRFLPSKVINGRALTGERIENLADHPVTLIDSGVSVLSFRAYATTESPISHNDYLGFAAIQDSTRTVASWSPLIGQPWGTNWIFGVGESAFITQGGYDKPVDLEIVVDGKANQVFGVYTFDGIRNETPRYDVSHEEIASINGIRVHVDHRDFSVSGSEFSKIQVRSSSVPKLEFQSSPFQICWDAACGFDYELQYSTSVDRGIWNVLSKVHGDGGRHCFTDVVEGGVAQRFYRLTMRGIGIKTSSPAN